MDIFEALKKHGLEITPPRNRAYQQPNKCYGCIFNGEYRDMGACTPLCDRVSDLLGAIRAHSPKNPCKYYITRQDIIALQNAILTEKGDNDAD